MFTIEIEGLEKVRKKLELLQNTLDSNELDDYIAEKAIDVINRLAKERLTEYDNYILSNHKKFGKDEIIIYNDVQNDNGFIYAAIIEYGSGVQAEKPSIANSDTYKATGGMFWYVPEDEAPELSEYYGEPFIAADGRSLFKVAGQTPKYIYEDAAKLIQRNIGRWASEWIKSKLKESGLK
jgi:hypothetical protein